MIWHPYLGDVACRQALLTILSLVYLLTRHFHESPNSLTIPLPFGLAVFFLGWLLRGRLDSTREQDFGIFILLLLWRSYKSVQLDWAHLASFWPSFPAIPTIATAVAIAGAALILRYAIPTPRAGDPPKHEPPFPLILPSRTTHTRFFPKRHSFSYSYLQVSVPVEFEGRSGSLLSVGETSKRGWFHVQASDYLDRTAKQLSLKAKLSAYLQSQDVREKEWDHAFLVTAPRFLGYSFNPVSFWYIYTKHGKLSMMILEVNNTFDERRMYLLRSDDNTANSDVVPKPVAGSADRFKHVWPKDFHVSPFSSRKGHYSLSAVDPFGIQSPHPITFDNTIVLKSSKDHAKLVARVFSDGTPVNPQTATWLQTIRVLSSWCWVGFLTAPRILKEAFVLYFKRSLHVWLRPEVLPSSIGRRATVIEKSLELFFESYLASLVDRSNGKLEVIYKSGLDSAKVQTFLSGTTDQTSPAERLEISVLSPVFFSRFVHYAHTVEAFDRECIFTDEMNRTVSVSRPELLPLLFSADRKPYTQREPDFIDRLRWNIHQQLRCPPASPTYLFPHTGVTVQDIRSFTISPLDRFVQLSELDSSLYRRQCSRLFLAQRFAFGFTEVVDILEMLVRVTLLAFAVSATMKPSSQHLMGNRSFIVNAAQELMMINSVNGWAYLKGWA